MGASEHVFVEQLVSRNSIEELIVQMNKREKHVENIYANDPNAYTHESQYYSSIADNEFNNDQKHKVRQLLSNVKLIRPSWGNDNVLSKRDDILDERLLVWRHDLTQVSTSALQDDSEAENDDSSNRKRKVKFF
jgi:hypothetical protein